MTELILFRAGRALVVGYQRPGGRFALAKEGSTDAGGRSEQARR
jgi:hypothetical protein